MLRFKSNSRSTLGFARRVAALAMLGGAVAAFPSASVLAETREPFEHSAKIGEKLQHGFAGIAFGFLEVPGTIVEQTQENGPWIGFAMGLTQGIGRFVTRELVGVYQVITAPFALPSAVQEPEFPWGYFEVAAVRAPDVVLFEAEERELRWIRGIEIERRSGSLVVTFPGDLLFAVGSDRIEPAGETRLIGLAETLLRHPHIQIEVQGHSDSTGKPEQNQKLSELRAESVEEFLLTQGMDARRIRTVGLGSSRPVTGEFSEDLAANRRVEVVLTQPVAAVR